MTLIPTNDPTVDLLGSLPRNAKIQDVASIQQSQESLGASNQPLQNVIYLCDKKKWLFQFLNDIQINGIDKASHQEELGNRYLAGGSSETISQVLYFLIVPN